MARRTEIRLRAIKFFCLPLAILISGSALAGQSENTSGKIIGKEATSSTKQKKSKKFAVKTPHKTSSPAVAKSSSSKKSKTVAAKTHKTKFVLNKKSVAAAKPAKVKAPKTKWAKATAQPPVRSNSTGEMMKAFSSNQKNQMVVKDSTLARAKNSETKSAKMPSLIPASEDSQRAANLLEADSGVHDSSGFTRTQIVDAPTARKPAAVASKTPERVAITFEHEQNK